MKNRKMALWRIEFATDATRADAPTLILGYMLEANWADRARWLGLTFRGTLMPLEKDIVNFKTWSELEDLETFMRKLFDDTWEAGPNNELRSTAIASKYPIYSALRFVAEDPAMELGEFDRTASPQALFEKLIAMQANLEPQLKASVHKMPAKKRPAAEPAEYEILSKKIA